MFDKISFLIGQKVYCALTSPISIVSIDMISVDIDNGVRYWTKRNDRFEVIPSNCFATEEEAVSYFLNR